MADGSDAWENAGMTPEEDAALDREIAQDELDAELTQAADDGDLPSLRAALAAGARVEARNGNGWHSLALAAEGGHAECLTALIQAGAPLDAVLHGYGWKANPKGWGWRAAAFAARCGSLECLRLLADAGAAMDVRQDEGKTPLMMAIEGKHFDCAAWLIKAGVDLDLRDREGRTAIRCCVYCSDPKTLASLIAHGADFSLPDHDGRTPEDLIGQGVDPGSRKAQCRDLLAAAREARELGGHVGAAPGSPSRPSKGL